MKHSGGRLYARLNRVDAAIPSLVVTPRLTPTQRRNIEQTIGLEAWERMNTPYGAVVVMMAKRWERWIELHRTPWALPSMEALADAPIKFIVLPDD